MTAELVLVAPAEEMDNETFARHMNLRHADSLGGLAAIVLSSRNGGLAAAWRAFHHRLHDLRTDLDHEHSEPE